MRCKFVFLIVLVLALSVASSKITVHNTSFQKEYYLDEGIVGQINLTLKDEIFDSYITSNKQDKISLSDFLSLNGVEYICSPPDCSNSYTSKSNSTSINLTIVKGNNTYAGFFVKGSGVSITGFNMTIASNFNKGEDLPLEIEFFEEATWRFSKFSNVFSPRNYGCYNSNLGVVGPLIRTSSYCELIFLKESAAIKAGAIVSKLDTKNLTMSLYTEDGGSSVGSCKFNPNSFSDCLIEAGSGEVFSEGKYQVCVSAEVPTEYKLYTESTAPNCGFSYSSGSSNSVKDYAIFAQTANYEDATKIKSSEIMIPELAEMADNLISLRYNRDCTNGCYLPLRFSGVSQNVNLSSLSLDVVLNGEDQIENKIHKLDIIPSTVSFSGVLDLLLTGFLAKNEGKYQLFIGNTSILSDNIKILPSPIVKSVSPLNPPAGIPVMFTAGVDYKGNISFLEYEWDFGDGSPKKKTKNSSVEYMYSKIGDFKITVKASAEGLSSQKSFDIKTVRPEEAINITLNEKQKQLDEVLNVVNSFPEWYRSEIKTMVDIENYVYELQRLRDLRDNAAGDESYLIIAKDLYSLDIPVEVRFDASLGLGLVDNPNSIDLMPVASYSGGVSLDYLSSYNQPVFNWQGMNVQSAISKDVITLIKESGTSKELMNIYSLDLIHRDSFGEAYLVINKPRAELYFNGNVDAKPSEGSTIIILSPNEWYSIKFYSKGLDEIDFFVAPVLTNIVLTDLIVEDCNFNLVCEDGETWQTCRSDCKPVKLAIIYYIIAFFFVLIIYILLQLWYANKYESHLFGDRNQLYNLLMYISNARARGFNDPKIADELKSQGWSAEKVTYAIRKSRGKSTGLPEIIPFSRFKASKMRKQAQANLVSNQMNNPQNQNPLNNKPFFNNQRPYRY